LGKDNRFHYKFDGYQRFFAQINVSFIHFIREWFSLAYDTPTSSKIGKYVSHPFGQMSKVAYKFSCLDLNWLNSAHVSYVAWLCSIYTPFMPMVL
jgi:hypothetical protein